MAQVKRNFLAALKERDRQFRFVGGCSANNLGGNPQSVGTRYNLARAPSTTFGRARQRPSLITRQPSYAVGRRTRPVLRGRLSGRLPRGRPSSASARLAVSYRLFCDAVIWGASNTCQTPCSALADILARIEVLSDHSLQRKAARPVVLLGQWLAKRLPEGPADRVTGATGLLSWIIDIRVAHE